MDKLVNEFVKIKNNNATHKHFKHPCSVKWYVTMCQIELKRAKTCLKFNQHKGRRRFSVLMA